MVQLDPYTISINQNRHLPSEKRSDASPFEFERSRALIGKKWGEVNARVGRETANILELGFGFKLLRNYISSFFDSEDNPALALLRNLFTATEGIAEGKRDQDMYGKAYGHGVDHYSGLPKEEIRDELIHEESAIEGLGG